MRKTAIALLAAASLSLAALSTPAAAKDRVRFAQSSWGLLFIPVMAAKELGYLEDENIEAEFTTGLGGAEALAAAVAGDVDIYVGAPSSALRSRAEGTNMRIFGAILTQYASNVVISKEWAEKKGVTADSPYEKKLEALRGAQIGVVGIGSGTHQLIQFLAKQGGMDPNRDMTISNLGGAAGQLAAFSRRRSDGFSMSSPTSDIAVRDHDGLMLFHTTKGEVEALDGFLYIGLIAREDWLEKNSDVVVRTLRAVQRTLDALHDPELTIKARDVIHAQYHNTVDKDFFAQLWEDALPAYPKSIEVSEDQIRRVVAFMNEFSVKPLPLDVIQVGYTNDYARKAAESMTKNR